MDKIKEINEILNQYDFDTICMEFNSDGNQLIFKNGDGGEYENSGLSIDLDILAHYSGVPYFQSDDLYTCSCTMFKSREIQGFEIVEGMQMFEIKAGDVPIIQAVCEDYTFSFN